MKAREGLSRQRILELAHRPQGFFVSYRYRDDTLRRKCQRLLREGHLRAEKAHQGTNYKINPKG